MEFKGRKLNAVGFEHNHAIGAAFETCWAEIEKHVPPSRELSLVATKLEEAAFFAKKGSAIQAGRSEDPT